MNRTVLLCTLFAATAAFAEAPDWGEFSREELFSTYFEEAPDADAVILFDHAAVKIDATNKLKVRRHRRTKVFTPAGASRGTVRIPYRSSEDIKDFRGHTFLPPDQKVKVEGKQLRTEEHGDWKVLIVEFPQVKPGAILEYQYEFRSEDLRRVEPWQFQNDDFTRVSRFDLQLPPGVAFQSFFGWMPGVEPDPVRTEIRDPQKTSRELVQTTWEFKDLPPPAAQPYESSSEHHRTTLFVELAGMSANGKTRTIAATWEELGKTAAAEIAGVVKDAKGVDAWAGAALASASTPRDKAEAACRLVRDGIATSDAQGWTTVESPAQVVAAKRGTPRAKNLLLLAILEDAGIPAEPVLVTTSRRGVFQERWHCLDQFDHTIVRAQSGGETIFMDANDPHYPVGVLPAVALGEKGLLPGKDGGAVVELEATPVESSRKTQTAATLSKEGALSAKSKWTFAGYPAIETRAALAKMGAEGFAADVLKQSFPNVAVQRVAAEGVGADAAELVLTVDYSIKQFAEIDRYDLVCGNPLPFAERVNPLPAGKRTVPLHFAYVGTTEDLVNLKLPKGYAVPEIPPTARGNTTALTFLTSYKSAEDGIVAKRKRAVRQVRVEPRDAPSVAGFFDKLVKADGSGFVAKRQMMRASK